MSFWLKPRSILLRNDETNASRVFSSTSSLNPHTASTMAPLARTRPQRRIMNSSRRYSVAVRRISWSRRVTRRDQEIRLTATEYRLLEFMMRRCGRVLARGAIVEAVWGFNEDVEENT